jgi:hypothetical protein
VLVRLYDDVNHGHDLPSYTRKRAPLQHSLPLTRRYGRNDSGDTWLPEGTHVIHDASTQITERLAVYPG